MTKEFPEHLPCEIADIEGGLEDLVTGKALAPLRHEGLPAILPLILPRRFRMKTNSIRELM
jgi:hypothetical protein